MKHRPYASIPPPQHIAPADILLTPGLRPSLPAAFLNQLARAFAQSLFWVYALMVLLMIVAAILLLWFPHEQQAHPGIAEVLAAEQSLQPAESPLASND